MNKYIPIIIALLIPLASFAQLGNTINTVGGSQAMTAPSNSVSSSTNGAVWVATNSVGQGAWSTIMDTRASTYSWPVNSQTTNKLNLVITGVGFKPRGCIIFCNAYNIANHSQGSVDSYGNQYSITQNENNLGYFSNYAAELLWSSGQYSRLSFSSWDADGATFTRSCSASVPANDNVWIRILFFR